MRRFVRVLVSLLLSQCPQVCVGQEESGIDVHPYDLNEVAALYCVANGVKKTYEFGTVANYGEVAVLNYKVIYAAVIKDAELVTGFCGRKQGTSHSINRKTGQIEFRTWSSKAYQAEYNKMLRDGDIAAMRRCVMVVRRSGKAAAGGYCEQLPIKKRMIRSVKMPKHHGPLNWSHRGIQLFTVK